MNAKQGQANTAGPKGRESLSSKMRVRGLRLTGPRRTIAAVLEAATEHLDAESVVARVRRKDPLLHRATVYRTLRAPLLRGAPG